MPVTIRLWPRTENPLNLSYRPFKTSNGPDTRMTSFTGHALRLMVMTIRSPAMPAQRASPNSSPAAAEMAATLDDTLRRRVPIAFRDRAGGVDVAADVRDIETDHAKFKQILYNLLSNAVKFSKQRSVVTIRARVKGDVLVVTVIDRGIGIARGDQQKIFDRFHRVAGGLVHDVRGSGLGLSIVDHVVRAHGGRVTVDSDPGRGSTFVVHLPLAVPAEEPGVARPAAGTGVARA